jgi:hypothetical protein
MASATSPADGVDDYLARIGVTRPASADLQALRDLQMAHLLAVLFEILSIHLGEPIILDRTALVTKVTRCSCRRRCRACARPGLAGGDRAGSLSPPQGGACGRRAVPGFRLAADAGGSGGP